MGRGLQGRRRDGTGTIEWLTEGGGGGSLFTFYEPVTFETQSVTTLPEGLL